VPLAPIVVNTLREWRLACPKGSLDLVFPTGAGNVEDHPNIIARGWNPVQVAAGVVTSAGGGPKYNFHVLRHAAASMFIEQGMNPKRIQTRAARARPGRDRRRTGARRRRGRLAW
jgi:integrase